MYRGGEQGDPKEGCWEAQETAALGVGRGQGGRSTTRTWGS